ncbi:hypothetical protein OH76DRAFT_1424018, partial [Lentinus brumalis]
YRKIREPGFAGCARAEVEEGGQNKVAIRDAVTPGVIWIYRPDVLADGCPRTSCFVHRARFIAGRSHLNIYHFGQLTASHAVSVLLSARYLAAWAIPWPDSSSRPDSRSNGQELRVQVCVTDNALRIIASSEETHNQFQIWKAPMAFTVPKNGQCSEPRVEPVADTLGMRRWPTASDPGSTVRKDSRDEPLPEKSVLYSTPNYTVWESAAACSLPSRSVRLRLQCMPPSPDWPDTPPSSPGKSDIRQRQTVGLGKACEDKLGYVSESILLTVLFPE